MRKVKLLALLLAVLMVVTAFAGCANTDVIESDVANLDERVTALENLLNGIDKELDDTNAKLEDTNKKLEDTNAKIEEVDSKIDKLDETLKGDKTDEEVAELKAQLAEQQATLKAQSDLLTQQAALLTQQAQAAEAQKALLEAQIKQQQDALAAQKDAQDKANADLLAKIEQMLADQKAKEDAEKEAAEQAAAAAKKALDDAKTAANAQIAAIEAANPGKYADLIAAAKATVTAATTVEAAQKAVETLNAGIAAQNAADAAAAAEAARKAALNAASERIAELREDAAADKVLYFAADYKAIVKALAAADAALTATKTVDEINEVVANLDTELAKYVAMDDALYNYVVKIWGNLTEESRPVYEEMGDYLLAIFEEYEDVEALLTQLALGDKLNDFYKYEYGVAENGDKKVMHIFEMIEVLDKIYSPASQDVEVEATVVGSGSASYVLYSEITSSFVTYNLVKATAEAKKLDARINDFLTNQNFKENYAFLRAPEAQSMFGQLNESYEAFLDNTKIYPASIRALVTKLSEVERLKAKIANYEAAEKALLELGKVDYTSQTVLSVFEEHGYDALYDSKNNPFYDVDKKTYATKAIFAPIDAELSAWATKFGLDATDSKAIIVAMLNDDDFNYAEYETDKKYVKFMDDKFAAFKKDIIPLIDALAGQKYVNKNAFTAYKNLDDKLADWASDKVGSKYDYVNTTNLALMFNLLGEDFAGITLYSDKQTSGNIGWQSGNNISVSWLNKGLVDFKYAEVEVFFKSEFAGYKTLADAINNRIEAVAKLLSDRKLYSIIDVLEIEDKTIKLSTGTYISLDDAAILLTVKNHDGKLAWTEEGVTTLLDPDDSTTAYTGTAGTYKYLSDLDNSSLPAGFVTIREFEEKCADKGYVDLAEYLIKYNDYKTLKSNFEKRIKELLDNGATKFIADVKAVGTVNLKNTTVAANPGVRDYETKYEVGSGVLYVTLADEAKFEVAKKTLTDWVTDYAGRTEYQETIAKEIKFSVTNKGGSSRELVYTGGFVERDILQGFDVKYGNIYGQMTVLNAAEDALVAFMTQVKTAMDLAAKTGVDFDLNNVVLASYSVDSKTSKVTVKELVKDAQSGVISVGDATEYASAAAYVEAVEARLATVTANTPATWYTYGELIQDAYTACCEFNILNQNWKADLTVGSAENHLKSLKVGGKAVATIIDELLLFYAKAYLIAQVAEKAADTTNAAYIAETAINGIVKCTILQGTTASAVSNWHEYLIAHFGNFDIAELVDTTKATAGADVVTDGVKALYKVVA